jgi:polyvinyl alcohol dehydrogenase (cytochrome)
MDTGKMLWHSQVTPKDAFVMRCPSENCPQEPGPDYDFGNAPILRELPGGKRVIAIGQKSGVVWGLDPDAEGKVLWQTRVGKGSALGGLEWGSAADEQNVYAPLSDVLLQKEAGGIAAIRLASGEKIWFTPPAKLDCELGRGCNSAQSAPASVIPGVVFSGAVDGHLRAYSTKDGSILWDFNTKQEYKTVNGIPGKGGSIDAAGPAVAGGMLFSNSGYGIWMGVPGNVLLAFTPDGK